jgi:hypothetical protein
LENGGAFFKMNEQKLNIIFDDRRPERYGLLVNEFRRQGISNYEIWPCIIRPSVLESITMSFKMIVRAAKEKGLEDVVIGEDDLWFPAKDGWDYFLRNKPENFDVYIGGTYLIENPQRYKPPVVKVKAWVGNHLIIINEKYYDTFLSLPDSVHCDTANDGLGDFYVCYPFAALQRAGYSSNNKTIVDYNKILNPEWVYGGIH